MHLSPRSGKVNPVSGIKSRLLLSQIRSDLFSNLCQTCVGAQSGFFAVLQTTRCCTMCTSCLTRDKTGCTHALWVSFVLFVCLGFYPVHMAFCTQPKYCNREARRLTLLAGSASRICIHTLANGNLSLGCPVLLS